jgi:hypothetical protein
MTEQTNGRAMDALPSQTCTASREDFGAGGAGVGQATARAYGAWTRARVALSERVVSVGPRRPLVVRCEREPGADGETCSSSGAGVGSPPVEMPAWREQQRLWRCRRRVPATAHWSEAAARGEITASWVRIAAQRRRLVAMATVALSTRDLRSQADVVATARADGNDPIERPLDRVVRCVNGSSRPARRASAPTCRAAPRRGSGRFRRRPAGSPSSRRCRRPAPGSAASWCHRRRRWRR